MRWTHQAGSVCCLFHSAQSNKTFHHRTSTPPPRPHPVCDRLFEVLIEHHHAGAQQAAVGVVGEVGLCLRFKNQESNGSRRVGQVRR